MEETVGNVTVTAELHETDAESITTLSEVCRKYDHLGHEMKEHVYAVFVNGANEVLADKLIGVGTAAAVNIDVTDIVRTAALINARAVILVHNHPSGDASPSNGDKTATQEVRKALNLLDIELLDHVIIARRSTHSMRDKHSHLFTR